MLLFSQNYHCVCQLQFKTPEGLFALLLKVVGGCLQSPSCLYLYQPERVGAFVPKPYAKGQTSKLRCFHRKVSCSIQASHSFLIWFSPKGLVLLLPLLPPVLPTLSLWLWGLNGCAAPLAAKGDSMSYHRCLMWLPCYENTTLCQRCRQLCEFLSCSDSWWQSEHAVCCPLERKNIREGALVTSKCWCVENGLLCPSRKRQADAVS